MKIVTLLLISVFFLNYRGLSQEKEKNIMALDPAFQKAIETYLSFSVPVISCGSLYENMDQFIILDARESTEYQVSHLKNARFVGHDQFSLEDLSDMDKSKPIVVYCSIGYRSEKIGEKLQKSGFTKVYNLFGSIFEWVNQGFPVYDAGGSRVLKVHTYNRKWSKWVTAPSVEKIW